MKALRDAIESRDDLNPNPGPNPNPNPKPNPNPNSNPNPNPNPNPNSNHPKSPRLIDENNPALISPRKSVMGLQLNLPSTSLDVIPKSGNLSNSGKSPSTEVSPRSNVSPRDKKYKVP